ncbi:MAG: alpha-glucuronidase family glycosyl hydrolase [Paludibacter sp.]|nr:alpha-glucuronidase family glycosyl hydrolase [Paludibacter sp.]
MSKLIKRTLVLGFILSAIVFSASAEDGSRLWLRFNKTTVDANLFSSIVAYTKSLPYKEFQSAWTELKGQELASKTIVENGSLLIGTAKDKQIRNLGLQKELVALGNEGYMIKSVSVNGKKATVVASLTDKGLLYGVFHLLRLVQLNEFSDQLNVKEKPSYALRILNHWDNLDGTVERGYSGHSIWNWEELPTVLSPRYQEYARANASIGINATVLNNVNASPKILSDEYLQKVKAIAGVLRPYNMRVFLSINFSSPKELGGLPTSDPLDVKVQQWWKDKANEIYKLIPDFGGFLVKANSEGLPGPMDYGRTHVDGANMLADALKPHGGIVMWRAFVYEPGDDRAKLAYKEFINFDGKFKDNVMIQVKNGPIDFQPREPFSPLFGAMKKTPLMPELQITQEYLGHSNHLVFLSPMWEEFLKADTYCNGKGATVAKVTDGHVFGNKLSAIAGVANIGKDVNWTGHHFAQANWYAFGRLSWNNQMTSEQIADEWIKMTFTFPLEKETSVAPNSMSVADFQLSVKNMMLASHQTAVDYMMPLGLHHIFAWTHHYGPEPWCDVPGARPDWLPKYYHNADAKGVGFDRTTSGSNAVGQYASPLKEQFNDPATCPDAYILWFHHLAWDYKMKSGRTLWDEMCYTYDKGVNDVRGFQKIWDKAEPFIDAQRFAEVQSKLRIQAQDAVWWKDACLLYFQTFSKRPIPYDIERPVHNLEDLKKIKLNMGHHN